LSRWSLCDPEINYLGRRHTVVQRHQDVRRLDIAMDNPFLMAHAESPGNLHEQFQLEWKFVGS
jgi:hypothetical protein